jgi:hypothetical protein
MIATARRTGWALFSCEIPLAPWAMEVEHYQRKYQCASQQEDKIIMNDDG